MQDTHAEFVRLLDAHRRLVFKVANAYAREAADRADLIQEISVELWRAFPRYDPALRFSTWAYRVALNVAISHARSALRRDRRHVPADESILEIAGHDPWQSERDERLDQLHAFIAQLDPIDRAITLLYLDDFAYQEIAESLGISASNVGTRIGRIKQKLRAAFIASGTLTGVTHGSR